MTHYASPEAAAADLGGGSSAEDSPWTLTGPVEREADIEYQDMGDDFVVTSPTFTHF